MARRPFTVRDSTVLATFETRSPNTVSRGGIATSVASAIPGFSPDHAHFAAITHRGILPSGQLQSTLWLFESKTILPLFRGPADADAVRPRALVEVVSSGDSRGITQAQWTADGQRIAFVQAADGSPPRLVEVDIRSGQVVQLSDSGQDVRGFTLGEHEAVFAATKDSSGVGRPLAAAGHGQPDIVIGYGKPLVELLYPSSQASGEPRELVLWKRDGKGLSPIQGPNSQPLTLTDASTLSLSPNGRFVVAATCPEKIPESWASFEPALPTARLVPGTDRAYCSRVQQFVLIDLATGALKSLTDSPTGASAGFVRDRSIVQWSPDSHRVLVSNTFAPIIDVGRNRRPCTAVVEIPSQRFVCVREQQPQSAAMRGVSDAQWISDSAFQITYREVGPSLANFIEPLQVRFQKDASGKYREMPIQRTSIVLDGPLMIRVAESLNQPQRLEGTNSSGNVSRDVFDPNPQLSEVELAVATPYTWRDSMGHELTGALMLPRGNAPLSGWPLVIQTHGHDGFDPSAFFVTGPSGTAFAAQALAGRGIAVLQVSEYYGYGSLGTPQEVQESGLPAYEAAIEKLSSERLIDRERLGIIGWSRTGFYVWDSLIRRPEMFRAASLAEANFSSAWEYFLNTDYRGPWRARQYEQFVGESLFGVGQEKWCETEEFNAGRVIAPVLMEANDPWGLIYMWAGYAALRLQGKPVDLLYIRNGAHSLTQPLQRLASEEMTVDWYDFWLNGHEDPDSGKADQYSRWRAFRSAQIPCRPSGNVRECH